MENFTLSVIIPVFNEEKTIAEVLKRIEAVEFERKGIKKEIIIVDDGSTDGSKDILESLNRYKVIYHKENKGKEEAIKSALKEVTGDYVIIQDADLELHPKDYNKMLRPVFENDAKVVFGSRWLNPENSHPYKLFYLGGAFLTFLANLLYGKRFTDIICGYKLFRTDVLRKLDLENSGFEFCCEVTAKISRKGIRVYEVPVSYLPRKKEEAKKTRLGQGLKMIFVLFTNRIRH